MVGCRAQGALQCTAALGLGRMIERGDEQSLALIGGEVRREIGGPEMPGHFLFVGPNSAPLVWAMQGSLVATRAQIVAK
eukprot:1157511-Pelagomonas_calceolata.AAC.4